MFDHTSRYAVLTDIPYSPSNGRTITYKSRRFLPKGDDIPELTIVRLRAGERLDRLTAQKMGDPEQFWQICDANNCMNPLDLFEATDTLRIPIPQAPEER